MDPLLALRQLISAVDWCLAKEERLAADSLKTLALGCVEPDVGRKRAAEDRGWMKDIETQGERKTEGSLVFGDYVTFWDR